MIANRNFRKTVAGTLVDVFDDNIALDHMYVYSGTMPLDIDVDNWTTAGYTGQLLCTVENWSLRSDANDDTNIIFWDFPNPVTVTATGTGTAVWYAIHLQSTNMFLLGTVSEPGGSGSLQIDSTTIASGGNVTVIDFNLRISIA